MNKNRVSFCVRWLLIAITIHGCAGVSGKSRNHYDRAVAFYTKARYEDAIEEYQLALYDSPSMVKAHFGLGAAYLKTEFYRGAVLALREVIALQPQYPDAHHNLGLAYYHLQNYNKAQEAFSLALRQNPKLTDARFAQAETFQAMGDSTKAIGLFEDLSKTVSEPRIHNRLGRLYRDSDQLDRAIEQFSVVARLDSTAFAARYEVSVLLEELGRHDEAVEAYRQARTLKETPELVRRLAAVYFLAGKLANSVVTYQELLILEPGNAETHFNLGVGFDGLAKREEAIKEYRSATQLDPDFADAYLNLAIDLLAGKRFQESLDSYEKFLEISDRADLRESVTRIVEKLKAALGR
jgi:tetratricopeptide (TPR) repeat protein